MSAEGKYGEALVNVTVSKGKGIEVVCWCILVYNLFPHTFEIILIILIMSAQNVIKWYTFFLCFIFFKLLFKYHS